MPEPIEVDLYLTLHSATVIDVIKVAHEEVVVVPVIGSVPNDRLV